MRYPKWSDEFVHGKSRSHSRVKRSSPKRKHCSTYLGSGEPHLRQLKGMSEHFSPERGQYLSPGFQPISANLSQRREVPLRIYPGGIKTRVARLRKAYVATAEGGCANPWLSGAP